jgi:hypothetical protein
MTTAKVIPLDHRHSLLQITPRLALISKALKTKNKLVAVYAGFETLEQASKFAVWVANAWGKNPTFDISTRPSKRLKTPFEVKVREPSLEQLHKLVKRAQAAEPPSNVVQLFRKTS